MIRTEIINYFIKKIGAKAYLEIGVREPESNFNNIVCDHKVAVDPIPLGSGILPLTSDQFFEQNKETFDVIFIDGLHIADQVERDILNSLKVLNTGGYVICHDMSPTDEAMQVAEYPNEPRPWTGDCWKAWVKLRTIREDLYMTVVNTDYGVGIIKKSKQNLLNLDNKTLNYINLEANRKDWLNLISVEEFLNLNV
jgi:hypothetical protein